MKKGMEFCTGKDGNVVVMLDGKLFINSHGSHDHLTVTASHREERVEVSTGASYEEIQQLGVIIEDFKEAGAVMDEDIKFSTDGDRSWISIFPEVYNSRCRKAEDLAKAIAGRRYMVTVQVDDEGKLEAYYAASVFEAMNVAEDMSGLDRDDLNWKQKGLNDRTTRGCMQGFYNNECVAVIRLNKEYELWKREQRLRR